MCKFFYFRLHAFPTAKKQPELREKWRKLINRVSPTSSCPGKLFTIKSKMRVCSDHFPDRAPSFINRYPSLNLGYDATQRLKLLNAITSRRKLNYQSQKTTLPQESQIPLTINNTKTVPDVADDINFNFIQSSSITTISNNDPSDYVEFNVKCCSVVEHQELKNEIDNLKKELQHEIEKNKNLYEKLITATSVITMKPDKILYKYNMNKSCYCKLPVYKHLLKSDRSCDFYTGLMSVSVFHELHSAISPLIKRRWRGAKKTSTGVFRNFRKRPKVFGPKRKLCSKDEFLMLLMKLRLGLLTTDLADRFNISLGLASAIFSTWVKASSSLLKHMVFVPNKDVIVQTMPNRFKKLNYADLHSILDGTEFFIETPKNLDLQKLTWSEYKHHNTVKILVSVAPNSSIVFVSKAYGGSISDKEITNRSNYLDYIPKYSRIMYDKGFNVNTECSEHLIYYTVPPSRKGAAQMTPNEVKKTKKIANLRILVEQVIRRLKTFRILATEFPITLLKLFDDVIIVCSALSNLRKPICLD